MDAENGHTAKQVAAIAKSLTQAQREALLLWDMYDFHLASDERKALAFRGVGSLRKLRLSAKPAVPSHADAYLTPLGLAVRAYIIGASDHAD